MSTLPNTQLGELEHMSEENHDVETIEGTSRWIDEWLIQTEDLWDTLEETDDGYEFYRGQVEVLQIIQSAFQSGEV